MLYRKKIFVFILQFTVAHMYRHHKPVAEKIWSERCTRNSVVLNDCNWCRCNARQKYDCKARVCEEIDMFGHFKDAVQEIDVGMEGHGSWRSRSSSCTPGVHYRRGAILCVCDEDGNWPNPVCRDLFQILHSVEITGQTRLSKNESCTPTKLYLVACNVCFCPSSGFLDPKLCTNKECQEDDPVLEHNHPPLLKVPPKSDDDVEEVLEIYAMCDPKYKYELGCRSCDCLRNNRLLCDNCTINDNHYTNPLRGRSKIRKPLSACNGKIPHKVFNNDCNLCYCRKNLNIICTVRRCFKSRNQKLKSTFKMKLKLSNYKQVEDPIDDETCIPGTRFKRDCNWCQCDELDGSKFVSCTFMSCPRTLASELKDDCVKDSFYEENCMTCHCYVRNNIKHRTCRLRSHCGSYIDRGTSGVKTLQGKSLANVNSLHGFCAPMHEYRKGCNICRCLADGKTIKCTSEVCATRSSQALSVDIVPVEMENNEHCPKGHSYKLDCNLCFCLSNGNAICTTAICPNNQ